MQLAELQRLRILGAHYREQMAGAAAQCCELLGVDPDDDSVMRDWCDEIVLHGADPQMAIDRIHKHRQEVA